MKREGTKVATVKGPRPRSREQTAAALKEAFQRLLLSRETVTITDVAKEVGVTPALIHNKYADLAEAIRKRAGKASRDQRYDKHRQLVEAKETIRDLRQANGALLEEVRVLASKNEALRRQLAEARAVASSKNVTPIRRKPS